MLNISGMLKSRQRFRLELQRKSCLNSNQNQRAKTVYVEAEDKLEAKRICLERSENKAFVVSSIKEIR